MSTDLNLRQRSWLELIKDYDLEIHYHPGKANVVADALSRKAYGHHLVTQAPELSEEMRKLNLRVIRRSCNHNLSVHPILDDQIKEAQMEDRRLVRIKGRNSEGIAPDFRVDKDEVLWFKKRLCVPKQGHFRRTILDEELVLHVAMLVVILWLFCVALCCHFTPHVPVSYTHLTLPTTSRV